MVRSGVIKKNPRTVGRYRVYTEVPSSWGYDKINSKNYSNINTALKEYNSRKKDLMTEEWEEGSAVILKDLNNNLLMYFRVVDLDSKDNDSRYDYSESWVSE